MAAPPRPWGFWLTAIFGTCIFGTYVVAQSIVVVIAALVNGSLTDPPALEALAMNGLVLSLCMLAGVPFIVGFSALFAWLRRGMNVPDYLGLMRTSWKTVVLGSICVVLLGFTYDWVSRSLGRPDIPEFMVNAYRTAGFTPLLWVAVIVAAPLGEEIFFRGFLFKGIEHSPVGGWGAILITSTGWALIHLQYDLFDMGAIFLLGILLGVFRWRTGSILAPLVMHGLQNLVATIQVAFLVD